MLEGKTRINFNFSKMFTYVDIHIPAVHRTTIVIQKSSLSILLHYLLKAHVECFGYPNASLQHPKLP